MDLVDIDKVLDNLELSEAADEQNKQIALSQQQKAAHSSTNGIVVLPPLTGAIPKTTTSNNFNKAFIGVSQVFNSLDDYQKNVESLDKVVQKYDEECRPISKLNSQNSTDHITDYDAPSTSMVVRTAQNEEHLNNLPYTYEDYDDDDPSTNDINSYHEPIPKRFLPKKYDDDDETNTSESSNSLTTSSPSTFSSGPSPGLGSTTDDRLTPLSPVDIEEQSALLAAHEEQQRQLDTTDSVQVLPDSLAQTEDRVGPLEDLAVGLSSISLTTGNSQSNLPCEASMSSVLENVLEELSEPTTTSLLSQLREGIDAKTKLDYSERNSITSVTASQPDNEAQQHKQGLQPLDAKKEIDKIANNHQVMPLAQGVQQIVQQQPITFGSTMDEISDTELDSMLQEMDIDDVAEEKPSVKHTTEAPAVHEPVVSTKVTPPKTEVNSAMVDDVPTNVADNLNADSFSQASTVEFSEIRTQSVQQQQPPIEETVPCTNSIASSYSSSESSLDGIEIGSDGENGDGRKQQRPQRPTTLDLPAVKMSNLVANAGQTPPGIALNPSLTDGSADVIETDNPDDIAEATGYSDPHENLGKIPPVWVPDNMAIACMQCQAKFTMIKRRHHCRACGQCICSVCCSQKYKLDFLSEPESRICVQCYLILTHRQNPESTENELNQERAGDTESIDSEAAVPMPHTPMRSPNPNNPMEYCSTIPPHRQVSTAATKTPSVIVPVGVLKKDGGSYSSNSSNSSGKMGRKRKSVMFSDGIAPGSELASLENQWSDAKHARRGHGDKSRSGGGGPPTPIRAEAEPSAMGLMAQLFRGAIPPTAAAAAVSLVQGASAHTKSAEDSKAVAISSAKTKPIEIKTPQRPRHMPLSGADEHGCFVPKEAHHLPPLFVKKDESVTDFDYKEVTNNFDLIDRLQRETLKFAVEKNFHVHVKIVNLKCCMNRTVINFTTEGMHHVGNDEIIILLEYEIPASKDKMLEPPIPKDIFVHLYEIYREAELGNPIGELSYTNPRENNFLGTRDYGGFIYIRNTFQCLQEIIIPENPFLFGILIHRWEVPWAKVFPLRLMLRLGAQYRYYPCPHISIRNRESVYAEIAQTIINFLADFRNYSYTLPCIRGMYIHMEDRQTTVLIPRNRQEDVIKAINNSSDHILAFGGNFSKTADGHLVCMQNVNDDRNELYSYSTQAINIQGQPRKVTGASFFVLNEALKSSSGLSGKCSIVEDGLMVQILPAKMEEVRNALRNQKDISIVCGPLDANESQTEVVSIKWVDNDRDFNIGVKSPIDEKSMEGISSMRVHASFNYSNANHSIRLTDIFILKFDEWYNAAQGALAVTSMDITRMAEQIARSASMALVPFLDLLVTSGSKKIALRATLHQDSVCYEAGARGSKLPPLYMNALDNHLIPTLHNESTGIDEAIILELIFYILNV